MGSPPPYLEQRWRPRRISAAVLRALIFSVPIGAGFVVGGLVAAALPDPGASHEIAFWWIAIISVATVTATAVDRLARRLLPLTVLLRMTMLFPDAAPSRIRTARRAGNVSELRRRIREAGTEGTSADLGEVAELVLALSTALSNHDRRTRGHSERTRVYTDLIAEEMGLPAGDRDRLRWAALLHDVGKLEVPAEILNKDSPLDDDEWNLIRAHPLHGMRLVAPLIPWLGVWAETIEHHHERFDGTGYPHGLAGDHIALGARIVGVADAYDVMTSGRSYQSAMTPAAARAEIIGKAGVQFDPIAARALMNVSLGKLRWAAGPMAALLQIPFRRGIPQIGHDLAVVLTTSAIVTTGFMTGVIPTPNGVDAVPAESGEVVIAGTELHQPSLVADAPGDFPLAAGEISATDQPPEPIRPVRPPFPQDDAVTTDEERTVTIRVLANDTDPDDDLDPASLAIVRVPRQGRAIVAGQAVIYTPAEDFHGSDALTYRLCDLGGRCATATAVVTVTPINDRPVTAAVSGTTGVGEPIELLLGYTDPDGDLLRCALADPRASGTATVAADCSHLRFEPPESAVPDVSIRIRVSDGTVAVTGVAVITVVGSGTEGDTAGAPGTTDDPAGGSSSEAPMGAIAANDDRVGVTENGTVNVSLTANDRGAVDGSTLTVAPPSAGTASVLGSSGRIRYTPPLDFTGTVTFSYTVCSASGECDSAVVRVDVG